MTLKAFLTQALRRCEAVATAEQCRTFAQPLEKRGSALCVRVRLCVSDPPVMFIFLRREGDGARVGAGEGSRAHQVCFYSAGIDLSPRQGELSAIWRRSRLAPRDIGAPLPRLR